MRIGNDLQVVTEDQIPHIRIRRNGETQVNASQVRLKCKTGTSPAGFDVWFQVDALAEFFCQGVKPRSPDLLQLFEKLAKFLQPLLATLKLFDMLGLNLLDSLVGRGEFRVDTIQ